MDYWGLFKIMFLVLIGPVLIATGGYELHLGQNTLGYALIGVGAIPTSFCIFMYISLRDFKM